MANPNFVHEGGGALADSIIAANGTALTRAAGSRQVPSTGGFDNSGPTLIQQQSGALTNRSGTITTGGVAQTLAAINAARAYLFIQNLHATEDLWINFTTAAAATQPSIRLSAGDTFSMEGSFVSTELVSVFAATTAHPFSAKEG
jgi:hypothetical protein